MRQMSTRVERQGLPLEDHIHRDPQVHAGYPVVAGTRTSVATIVVLYRDVYHDNLREVHKALPHLTVKQIKAALAYCQDNPEVVEEDIQRDDKAWAELVRKGWPKEQPATS